MRCKTRSSDHPNCYRPRTKGRANKTRKMKTNGFLKRHKKLILDHLSMSIRGSGMLRKPGMRGVCRGVSAATISFQNLFPNCGRTARMCLSANSTAARLSLGCQSAGRTVLSNQLRVRLAPRDTLTTRVEFSSDDGRAYKWEAPWA